ncbi:MAG: hypothetical protein LBV43_05950 [Prevotella sp.]|nr:hypothetical protein [Prevotella sp.]
MVLIIFSVLFLTSFLSNSFDSEFYHYQNIRWNEEYSAVPGLANLEDRFGFNSNYLLISAVFSLRFMFGDAIFGVQSLIFTLMLIWAFIDLYKSNFNVLNIIPILFFIAILSASDSILDNTSTDAIPLLCTFYYITKTALKSDWLLKQPFLAFILPIALVTYKLSCIIFCLICIYILFYQLKQRQYRLIAFMLVFSGLVILFWFARNVIISGYLIYPLSEIDLFAVDWKVPEAVATLQRAYIHDYAKFTFTRSFAYELIMDDLHGEKIRALNKILQIFFYSCAVLFPFAVLYNIFRKRKTPINQYVIYGIFYIGILFNFIFAPDPRFMIGSVMGISFLLICMIYSFIFKEEHHYPKAGKVLSFILAIVILVVAGKNKQMTIIYIYDHYKHRLTEALYKPLPHPWNLESDKEFDIFYLNETPVYLTKEKNGRTYDMLPSTNPTGLPFILFDGNKVQHIETIEMRGHGLQEGFRTKKEYVDTLNMNTDKYMKEYRSIFDKRYYGK